APHRLWEDVFDQVALDFPDVEHEALYPDNAVMHIIADPAAFDVVVTNLLFGGVLSDMVAALVGGIGLIGSSRINPDTRFGMFEPAHGSAPKYTGLDKVSPMATLKALAMMLDNVGEAAAASRIDAAMDHVLSTGKVPGVTTRSGMGTAAATDEVLAALDAPAEAEARG
ncbi:MAG: 3-isopropylmalate dehydrogenase, partial [Acidimicrobiaceae bacterium]|nr:3-isopropylmalate dehydrogenase [Acidimicrobiaceae bacterium]